MPEPKLHTFGPSGGVPNSALPLVFVRGGLPLIARSGETACALYEKNGWTGTWVYTVYPYWHFHTQGHEALACVAGSAKIAFGGDDGIEIDVAVGDVAILPAGLGHKKLSAAPGFKMAGAYPPGQTGNIVRPGHMPVEDALAEIARLKLPETDPITGGVDGVVAIWSVAA